MVEHREREQGRVRGNGGHGKHKTYCTHRHPYTRAARPQHRNDATLNPEGRARVFRRLSLRQRMGGGEHVDPHIPAASVDTTQGCQRPGLAARLEDKPSGEGECMGIAPPPFTKTAETSLPVVSSLPHDAARPRKWSAKWGTRRVTMPPRGTCAHQAKVARSAQLHAPETGGLERESMCRSSSITYAAGTSLRRTPCCSTT